MAAGQDAAELLQDAVATARARGDSLCITGSGSKAFLAAGEEHGPRAFAGQQLSTLEHRGVIDYRPEELVITVRAGTPLGEVESVLAEAGQYLPFEPPRFRGGGTLGGAVAAGLSGPGRPWRGAVRDAVLGVELVNGLGERLRFGGQVMKNVAGYDLSRLQAGAFGTLGLLLSVSLKVLPRPAAERTLTFSVDAPRALAQCRAWMRTAYPISAACHHDGLLRLRLSGAQAAIDWATSELGGEIDPAGATFWTALRDQTHEFFRSGDPLWRASLPPAAAAPVEDCLVNWAGAERWWRGSVDDVAAPEFAIQAGAEGGTARRFDGRYGTFGAEGPAARYAARLRAAFDPDGVLNPHLVPAHAD
jgi:glycolate oxidase FAD binding subunit